MSKVAHLVNYPTRYEVALEHAGRSYLVGYTIRRSRVGLLSKMRERGADILRITEMPESATVAACDKTLAFSNGSVIRFTGRTQREAITAGELPYVSAV